MSGLNALVQNSKISYSVFGSLQFLDNIMKKNYCVYHLLQNLGKHHGVPESLEFLENIVNHG